MEARPGQTVGIASAGKLVLHGAPVTDGGFTGVAIKIKQEGPDVGYGNAQNKTVEVAEAYKIQVKGRVYVANTDKAATTFAKGAAVYIDPADNALTSGHAGSEKKYGVVTEIAGERGVATGFMRVDLDLRSTF